MRTAKNLGILFLGIVLGIVLVVGGVVGGGYLLLTKDGMVGTVGDKIEQGTGIDLELSEEIRQLSLMNYGKEVLNKVSNIDTLKIGELEEFLGASPISTAIEKLLGIPKATSKECTVNTLPTTVMDNLSLSTVSEKFQVEFPDLPIFKDAAFLSQPLTTAFASFDTLTLDSFIAVVYNEDATAEKPASTMLLQKLGKKSMTDISGDMQGIINEMQLSDILVVNADSPKIIQSIKDCSLETIYKADGSVKTLGIQDKVDELTLKELLEISETSPQILKVIKDCTLETRFNPDDTVASMGIQDQIHLLKMSDILKIDANSPKIIQAIADCTTATIKDKDGNITSVGIQDKLTTLTLSQMVETGEAQIWKYLGDSTLDGLGKKVDDMTLADAILIDDNTNIILRKLKASKINNLGTDIQGAINTTTIGELLDIKEDTDVEPILKALSGCFLTSASLNEKMKTLTIADCFKDANMGILALVPPTTPLTGIATELSAQIATAKMYQLCVLGVFDANMESKSPQTKSFFYNKTASGIINGYLDVVNNPASAVTALLPKTHVYTDTQLTQARLTELGIADGTTLIINQATEIPANEVFTTIFSIDLSSITPPSPLPSTNAGTLTIGENVTVEGIGYMYITGPTASFIDDNIITSKNNIAISETKSEPSVLVEVLKK